MYAPRVKTRTPPPRPSLSSRLRHAGCLRPRGARSLRRAPLPPPPASASALAAVASRRRLVPKVRLPGDARPTAEALALHDRPEAGPLLRSRGHRRSRSTGPAASVWLHGKGFNVTRATAVLTAGPVRIARATSRLRGSRGRGRGAEGRRLRLVSTFRAAAPGGKREAPRRVRRAVRPEARRDSTKSVVAGRGPLTPSRSSSRSPLATRFLASTSPASRSQFGRDARRPGGRAGRPPTHAEIERRTRRGPPVASTSRRRFLSLATWSRSRSGPSTSSRRPTSRLTPFASDRSRSAA